MQEAADPWFLNFSTARAVYVATASSNSASDSTGLPKDLAVMMPFFGLGSVSTGMHAMPRSSNTTLLVSVVQWRHEQDPSTESLTRTLTRTASRPGALCPTVPPTPHPT